MHGLEERRRARRIRDPALRRDSCRRRRLLGHVGLHLNRSERPDEVEPHRRREHVARRCIGDHLGRNLRREAEQRAESSQHGGAVRRAVKVGATVTERGAEVAGGSLLPQPHGADAGEGAALLRRCTPRGAVGAELRVQRRVERVPLAPLRQAGALLADGRREERARPGGERGEQRRGRVSRGAREATHRLVSAAEQPELRRRFESARVREAARRQSRVAKVRHPHALPRAQRQRRRRRLPGREASSGGDGPLHGHPPVAARGSDRQPACDRQCRRKRGGEGGGRSRSLRRWWWRCGGSGGRRSPGLDRAQRGDVSVDAQAVRRGAEPRRERRHGEVKQPEYILGVLRRKTSDDHVLRAGASPTAAAAAAAALWCCAALRDPDANHHVPEQRARRGGRRLGHLLRERRSEHSRPLADPPVRERGAEHAQPLCDRRRLLARAQDTHGGVVLSAEVEAEQPRAATQPHRVHRHRLGWRRSRLWPAEHLVARGEVAEGPPLAAAHAPRTHPVHRDERRGGREHEALPLLVGRRLVRHDRVGSEHEQPAVVHRGVEALRRGDPVAFGAVNLGRCLRREQQRCASLHLHVQFNHVAAEEAAAVAADCTVRGAGASGGRGTVGHRQESAWCAVSHAR
mmetsp:Transcript_5229/g.16998  ORF Transcript_5229/g.16998 Transcript_5229/m.16998 type:complete len:631 (-) Transcript_5229:98-1990(-)